MGTQLRPRLPHPQDVDEAYMNKVELESRLEGLTDEINFFRQLYEEVCSWGLETEVPPAPAPSAPTDKGAPLNSYSDQDEPSVDAPCVLSPCMREGLLPHCTDENMGSED